MGAVSRVAVLIQPGFGEQRKASLIRSIGSWADKRSVEINTVQVKSPQDLVAWKDWDFAFCPLTALSTKELSLLPPDLPVVVDLAAPISNDFRASLSRLRVAGRIPWQIDIRGSGVQQLLPMVPPPPESSPRAAEPDSRVSAGPSLRKTVIFVDSKPFHETSTLLQIAATLAGVLENVERAERLLGRKIWFYFTSFMPPSLYGNLLDTLDEHASLGPRKNLSTLLSERLLTGSRDYAGYQSLLDKALLFITEHGELADFDLAQAVFRGTPTLLFRRKFFSKSQGIRSSIMLGLRVIDDDFPVLIDQAASCRVREEWGLDYILKFVPDKRVDSMLYERVYLGSWDIARAWALGQPHPGLHSALLQADKYTAGTEIALPTLI